MIRFLNLKNQICEGSNDFAFYDTVSNTICSFGEQGEYIFCSIDEFKYSFGEDQEGTTRPLSRFLNLIPEDYFENNNMYILIEKPKHYKIEMNNVLVPYHPKLVKACRPNLLQKLMYRIGLKKDPRFNGKKLELIP